MFVLDSSLGGRFIIAIYQNKGCLARDNDKNLLQENALLQTKRLQSLLKRMEEVAKEIDEIKEEKEMKKRMLSVLMALCMVLGTAPTMAFAAAGDITVSKATYYNSGALKGMTTDFNWYQGEAKGRLVLTSRYLDGQTSSEDRRWGAFSDFGWVYDLGYDEFSDVLAHDTTATADKKFEIISYGASDTKFEYSFGTPNHYELSFELNENDIPLNEDGMYYVYLWVKYEGRYFPDNLICAIRVNNGAVEYVAAKGDNNLRNEYDSSAFRQVESQAAYNVTITAGANMTTTSEKTTQNGLTKAMEPVVYTANDGYEFPEDYAVATVNGIMVKRDNANQITVYGTPSADATITLASPSAVVPATPSTPTTPNIGDADSIFDVAIPFTNVFDCQRSPGTVTESDVGKRQYCYSFAFPYAAIVDNDSNEQVDDIIKNANGGTEVTDYSGYYYKFTKNNDGTITQTLYGPNNWSHTMATDGKVAAYGERCFLLYTDETHYGTFVSFKDKNYHFFNSCATADSDNDPELSDIYESYIDHGCGESFIIGAFNPSADDMGDLDNIVTPSVTYTVSFNANGGSGSKADVTVESGATYTLPAANTFTAPAGKVFDGWDVGGTKYAAGASITVSASTTVKALWKDAPADPTPSTPSSSKKPTYPAKLVKDADVENGSISFSKTRAKAGRTVTITVTPDAGFALDKLVILNDDGKAVDFKDNGNGTFTFTMPKGGVEVEPFFVKEAVEEPVTLVLFVNQVAYLLDNEPMVNDVAPVVQAERTTLPIRLVAETLGAEVDWNEAEQTVTITKDGKEIVIYIGQGFALVNGAPVELDCPAYIANSRTYLPVRFVSENMGAKVTWGGADGSVTIVVE